MVYMNVSQSESDMASEKNYVFKKKSIYEFIKRLCDILISFVSIILLSWLFILLALIIKITSRGPVFYKQIRIGKKGKEFTLYKFRSMKVGADKLESMLTPEQLAEYHDNYKLSSDPRITRVGSFLRRTSLDELPQIFNVLKGNISLIGPRPVLEEETYLYGKNRDFLLSIKPGLTGYWAANGRSDTTYETRIEMELFYVEKRSFILDIKILIKTFFGVIFGKGAR